MEQERRRIEEHARSSAIVRLWDALTALGSTGVFLQTGAHPDDETSAVLAMLARRDGVRVGYACAVRGEGGQNALGRESGDALGALRTREMERAAAAIPMALFWLSDEVGGPIRDFGFSRSADETLERWGHERLVRELVRVMRAFRPDVVASTFLDVPGQHGHHRAVTRATEEAFDLAGDAGAFTDLGLHAWQPRKLYLPAWSGAGSAYDDAGPPPAATLTVDVGEYDAVQGATYAQIGQRSRAEHRCQGMGRWLDENEEARPWHRLRSLVEGGSEEAGFFDGIPTTLADWAGEVGKGGCARALVTASKAIEATRSAFPDTRAVADAAHHALAATRRARTVLHGAGGEHLGAALREAIDDRLESKLAELQRVSIAAMQIVVRLGVERARLAPGERTEAVVSAYCAHDAAPASIEVEVVAPEGWTASAPVELATEPGRTVAATFELAVSEDAPFFDPFPPGPDPIGAPAGLHARVRYACGDVPVEVTVAPPAPVAVLPAVALAARPARAIINLVRVPGTYTFEIAWRSLSSQPLSPRLAADLPPGWRARTSDARLLLGAPGDETLQTLEVAPPASLTPGRYSIALQADQPARCASSVRAIAYPHVPETYVVEPTRIELLAVPVEVPPGLRVGYVDGGSDRVWSWLEALGVGVERLDAQALARGEFAGLHAIMVGITALATRPDLARASGRLRRWVEDGGNLVTQYQRPWDGWDPEGTPPRRLEIGRPSIRWRVTDPSAPVEILAPAHPVLAGPNRIVADDFDGWVRERGLYFASAWDDAYEPLLALGDPGETPLEGALLSAACGRGRHTHVALALHHQLDALVPGAFRLLANLVGQ